MCFMLLAELHAKTLQLYKASLELHGPSITRSMCARFVKLCPVCIRAQPRKARAAGHQPIITHGYCSRGQVDLIDFQSLKDREYAWLLVYQDHGTKFCMLIPLTSKRKDAVAMALIRIFTMLGAPAILQTDNGREFAKVGKGGNYNAMDDEDLSDVIGEIYHLWPEVRMVKGRPRHSESNGGVERLNLTVQRRLNAWMTDSQSSSWSIGCMLVQWAINTTVHSGIQQMPYMATFGQAPRAGFAHLPVSPGFLSQI